MPITEVHCVLSGVRRGTEGFIDPGLIYVRVGTWACAFMADVNIGWDLFCESVHENGGVVTEIAARLDVEKHFHGRHLAPCEERFVPVRERKFEPLEIRTLYKEVDEIRDRRVLR